MERIKALLFVFLLVCAVLGVSGAPLNIVADDEHVTFYPTYGYQEETTGLSQ